jgi:PAS domain S-box-containing protein
MHLAIDEMPPVYVGIMHDISARQAEGVEQAQREEQLRESETRFRTIFAAAPIGISYTDADGNILQVNQALQDLLGYTEAELLEKGMTAITHPDDVAESRLLCRELRAGQRDRFQVEKRYFRKDGRLIWTTLTVSAVCDTNGIFRYMISTVEDISERKQAEEALRYLASELASRAGELNTIIEAIPDGVYVCDATGNLTRANARAADWRLTPEEQAEVVALTETPAQ